MKKLTFLAIVLSFFLTTPAQVTITQADVEAHLGMGKTITSYSDTLGGQVNIGAPGQSSWEFTGHPFQLQFDATVIPNGNSPAAGSFGGATHTTYSMPTFAGVTSETWVHLSVGNGAYSDLGTYTSVTSFGFTTNTTIEIAPSETILQLPLNFGASWSQTGVRSFDVAISGIPGGQQHDINYTFTRTVDAWGSLTMPNGTVENVLRIKIESELSNSISSASGLSFHFISPSGSSVTVVASDPNAPDNGTISAESVTWYYGNGTPSDVEQLDELANSFSLAQNYPNPFNPVTNIQYSIPQASYVTLKVYDVLGNEIATLVNEKLSAGVYNSRFDGAALSSGIYFYTLKADNFADTKKLILVK